MLLGGILSRVTDVAPTVYIGGICLCVSSFTTWTDTEGVTQSGMLDHLQVRFGVGAFDAGKESTRFTSFINAGSKLDKQRLTDTVPRTSGRIPRS